MQVYAIHADQWFDGERLHTQPVSCLVAQGRIVHLITGPLGATPWPASWHQAPCLRTAFLMPGLVDAHVHLFLDGDATDAQERQAHQHAGLDAWLVMGRRNLQRAQAAGITCVRDCGDAYGINQLLRAEENGPGQMQVLSAGCGIRAPKRYGSFFATEWDPAWGPEAVASIAGDADLIKLVLSGIIDFAAAAVKGRPQFAAEELRPIVVGARVLGLPTTAHCSGDDAIATAITAGLDGIEHGFCMRPEQLMQLADADVVWCFTWRPVDAVRRHPDLFGVDDAAVAGIGRILDAHRAQLARAPAAGVQVLPGTDAGSMGVPHGRSLVHELRALAAAGWDTQRILHAATRAPRQRWGLPGGRLAVGERMDCAGFAQAPDADFTGWEQADLVVCGGALVQEPAERVCA
ncbi:MAG: amidohydrolase family protein [Planctomycetota bacterium]